MVQVVAPDLNTVGDVGWCLAFVEKAYNDTNYSYATATDGWNACQFIHQDRNLPSDVCVPIWFSYYETEPDTGKLVNYGHVAINVPGRGVLSSPYKADGTQQWYDSIDQLAKAYHCTYLGWSEDLMGVRVITEGDDMALAPEDQYLKDLGLALQSTKSWPAINTSTDQHVVIQNVVDVIDSLEDFKAETLAKPSTSAGVSRATALDYVTKNLK